MALSFKNFCPSETISDEEYKNHKIFPHYCLQDDAVCVELRPEEFFAKDDNEGNEEHSTIIKRIETDGKKADYKAGLFFIDVEYVERNKIMSENNLIPVYTPDGEMRHIPDGRVLGRYKTNCWDYEAETRIIVQALMRFDERTNQFPYHEALFLKLNDEFFRELKIILNPWRDDNLRSCVKSIIKSSRLCKEIKETIKVCDSDFYVKI
jgi:hypothetical protein